MKNKILAMLKAKYKSLGLSDEILEGLATMLAGTTTEDDQIETAVAGVESMLKGVQSHADKRVTDAVKEHKKANPEQPKPVDPPAEPAPAPAGTAADFTKAITDLLKPLQQEIASLKQSNISKSRQQQLEEKLAKADTKFKDQALKAFKRMQFETDDDFSEYLTELETDMGQHEQQETNEQMKAFGKPMGGNGTVKENEVSPFMKTLIKERADAAKAASV